MPWHFYAAGAKHPAAHPIMRLITLCLGSASSMAATSTSAPPASPRTSCSFRSRALTSRTCAHAMPSACFDSHLSMPTQHGHLPVWLSPCGQTLRATPRPLQVSQRGNGGAPPYCVHRLQGFRSTFQLAISAGPSSHALVDPTRQVIGGEDLGQPRNLKNVWLKSSSDQLLPVFLLHYTPCLRHHQDPMLDVFGDVLMAVWS